MTLQTGPTFNISGNCKNCEFVIDAVHPSCKKLNALLEVTCHEIKPHKKCPFISNNEIDFLENRLKEIEDLENNRLKDIIFKLFPLLTDYKRYDSGLTFQIGEFHHNHYKLIEKLLPEYEVIVSAHNNLLVITLSKKS